MDLSFLLAQVPSTPAAPGLQGELVRRYGFDPLLAGLIMLVATTAGSMLARWLWVVLVAGWQQYHYGGWVLRVSGGKTGRVWHMPIDLDIIKALKQNRYVTFKRDLGTMLSGEGQVDFSLGVDQGQPLRSAPSQATGLSIDMQRRVIEMRFQPALGKAPAGLPKAPATGGFSEGIRP